MEFHGNSRAESKFDKIMLGRTIINASNHTTLAIRDPQKRSATLPAVKEQSVSEASLAR
jgi:hypothetical protein